MKQYKYRGCNKLITWFVIFALGLVFFLAFDAEDELHNGAHYAGVSLMISSCLLYLRDFFRQRKLTPEQFEKQQVKEKQDNDERSFQIQLRAFRAAETAGILCMTAGLLVFAFIFPNDAAMWATLVYIMVMAVTLGIAREVYSSKM